MAEIGGLSKFFLPLDVVTNILSKLPTKSLARFRCVCKRWYSLTYDPYLLNLECSRSSSLRILCQSTIHDKIIHYDFKEDEDTLEQHSYNMDFGEKSGYQIHLSNAINGLTFAYRCTPPDSQGFLLNPTTRESVKIPSRRGFFWHEKFGLGIDVSTGKYKVIAIFARERYARALYCEILTVGSGQWRCLGKAPHGTYFMKRFPPVFLHGSLHWVGLGPLKENIDSKVLVTFDVKDEKFGPEIPTPGNSMKTNLYLTHMEKSREHIFLSFLNTTEDNIEIWMLKDYADHKWIRILADYNFHCCLLSPTRRRPVVIGIADDMLLLKFYEAMREISIYRFDLRRKTLHKLLHGKVPVDDNADFIIYKDSLISPLRQLSL